MLKLFRSEFVKFLLAGGASAAANFLSRMLFGMMMPFAASVVCAYGIGMLSAFLLFKYLVFTSSNQSTRQQVSYFAIVNVVSATMILAVSLFLYHVGLTWIHDDFYRASVSHGISLGILSISSYIGHKLFTFRVVEA